MIEAVLVLILLGIVFLIYQGARKNKPDSGLLSDVAIIKNDMSSVKENASAAKEKLENQGTTMKNIENLFSGGPKAYGVIGETHMFALIEQILSPAQYIKNQKINNDTVECCIKIKNTLCPCDSYFGTRELEKLNQVLEERNKEQTEEARKEFGQALIRKAKQVKEKYISPPLTTPFACVYLPSEGAFLEAIKLKDKEDNLLVASIRNKHKVIILGPTTFTSFLDSLLVGFETLQITKDASRIYDDLQKIATKFSTHMDQIEDVVNKITKASEASSKFSNSATSVKSLIDNIKKPKE